MDERGGRRGFWKQPLPPLLEVVVVVILVVVVEEEVMRVFPLRCGVSSSEMRSLSRVDGFETEKEKAEKRERIGCETWLVNRGRIIGRQTLAEGGGEWG